MTRKKARELAFKLLYQIEIQKESPQYILDIYYGENSLEEKEREYVEDVLFGSHKNKHEINGIISRLLEGWRIERLTKISLSIITLSVYEILYRQDIPDSVSISEAVTLAKRYEGPEAASFVNGVLASVLKEKGARERE
ncbi:MAG: hypothetical protein BWY15_00082 [Firmicutes bacterium ADurb.Bin193]|nr:MAG: hypothetical protein BWY15_00082 [Firmicutes bacterium ADurb.Bin193]